MRKLTIFARIFNNLLIFMFSYLTIEKYGFYLMFQIMVDMTLLVKNNSVDREIVDKTV